MGELSLGRHDIFSYKSVSDISPLARLTNLRELHFSSNSVSDIFPLAGLTNLVGLDFSGNSVSDISALVENEGIASEAYVFMQNNYLDLTPGSQNMNDINALLGRGVEVSYGRQR